MPKCAIFADTQAEPASVYRWLDWLEKQLPFPVHRVTRSFGLTASALQLQTSGKTGKTYLETGLPVFYLNGVDIGIGRRQCTEEFKLWPLYRKLKELAGDSLGIIWVGISIDEASRMKPARQSGFENRWPLIEKEVTRRQCLKWMRTHNFPEPPRSACVYCPFHNESEWRRLKVHEPLEFARAIDFEYQLQRAAQKATALRGTPFLHRSCKSLDKVDLSTEEERGQLNMFNNECEGMCGV